MARGLLDRNHDLYIKQGRTAALKQSDLMILAGVIPDFHWIMEVFCRQMQGLLQLILICSGNPV